MPGLTAKLNGLYRVKQPDYLLTLREGEEMVHFAPEKQWCSRPLSGEKPAPMPIALAKVGDVGGTKPSDLESDQSETMPRADSWNLPLRCSVFVFALSQQEL